MATVIRHIEVSIRPEYILYAFCPPFWLPDGLEARLMGEAVRLTEAIG